MLWRITIILQQRWQSWKCSRVIIPYHRYLSVRRDVNLSDLVRAAQRAEFKAGHLGAKLAASPAEEHQPVTTCMLPAPLTHTHTLSLLFQHHSPHPPPPCTPPHTHTKKVSSASQPYPNICPVHLICPSAAAELHVEGSAVASAVSAAFILSLGCSRGHFNI